MRRVVAIAGGLCLVGALTYVLRREASPTQESGRAEDSPSIVSDDARGGVLQGAPAGPGRARGTAPSPSDRVGTTVSDASPGVDAKGMVPLRPHLRRTILGEDGRPVAGARVEAFSDWTVAASPESERAALLADGRTDVRGRIDIEFAGEHRPMALRVTVPGGPPLWFHAHAFLRTLRLPPTTRVRGRVLARESGAPIAGATVETIPFDPRSDFGSIFPFTSTRSTTDGTFTLHVSDWGRVSILAKGLHSWSDRKEIGDGGGDVSDIVLTIDDPGERGTAEGRVLFDGRPVSGVRVGLEAGGFRTESASSAPTGADGTYRVGPVWNGVEEVVIDASAIGLGRTRSSAAFEVHDGRAIHDLVLERPFSVTGRVTRAGIGVANAVVSSMKWIHGAELGFAGTTTDASGNFRLVGCFERRMTVTVLAKSAEGDSMTREVAFDDSTWDVGGVEIGFEPFGRIRGRVSDPDGRPIAGARVRARSDVVTDSGGRFDVVAVPGRTRVSVACEGFVERTSAWTQVPIGSAGAELDVVLQTGGVVSGRVWDSTGAAVMGALIQVDGVGGIGGVAVERVDSSDGYFQTHVVAGSVFRVTVSAAGFATRVIEAVEPDTELPDLVLERTAEAPAPR